MTSESEPIRKSDPAPNTGGKPNTQTPQSKPDIPRTPGIPSPPPSKTHYEITCKTEKDLWDHIKTGAEILGIILLGVYTAYTIKMYCANKEAADAAKNAAETAARQLDMSERPWINPDIGIADNVDVEQTGITVKIGVRLKNTGHSPATALRFQAETIAVPVGPTGDAETIKERDRVCGVAQKEISEGNDSKGETIFPDSEGITRYVTMVLAKDEMDASIEKWKSVTPMIVTCVAYLPTFERTIHTTAKVFLVLRIDPVTKVGMAFFPSNEGTIFKPGQFALVPNLVAGVYAD